MRCAETGLEPIGAGGAWPVPFRNKHTETREVQFIPDWRGLINLAKRTGQITHAYGEIVCEGDEIDYAKGDHPHLTHKPALCHRGEPIGVYCVVVLPDDSRHIEYMDKEEIDSIRNRSKASDKGPWVTDWGQMAIKTVVKRALKPFAGSPEMQTAINLDNEAVGLALPEAPTPVEMPRRIEAETPGPLVETPTPPAPQERTIVPEDGQQIITGTYDRVTPKTGENKQGPWQKWAVRIDGEYYSTFSETLAGELEMLVDQPVVLTYKADGKYRTAMSVLPVVSDDEPPPMHDDEPLPI
jgi:recombinational DNA repair protein RecT